MSQNVKIFPVQRINKKTLGALERSPQCLAQNYKPKYKVIYAPKTFKTAQFITSQSPLA